MSSIENYQKSGIFQYYSYLTRFKVALGLYCLLDKPWLTDLRHCWYGYPWHPVSPAVWWYYMTAMTYFWSLCVSQFIDVKRKDFWQLMVHHVTTLALMAFSWTCNLTRMGTLVLLVHDCADVFLEAAKACRYAIHITYTSFLTSNLK